LAARPSSLPGSRWAEAALSTATVAFQAIYPPIAWRRATRPALRGFICPCGGMTEIRFDHRSAVEITYLCTVCRQPVTVPARLVPNINHVLLPGPQGGQFGEVVHFPDWKWPRWNEG
jgi:hypothetical protein